MIQEATQVLISGNTCEYDKLPDICKTLVSQANDIQFKYVLIILVGFINILVMVYFVYKMRQYIELKKKETGVGTIRELIDKVK